MLIRLSVIGVLAIPLFGCTAEVESTPDAVPAASGKKTDSGTPGRDSDVNTNIQSHNDSWEELRVCDNACIVILPKGVRLEEDNTFTDIYISKQTAYYATFDGDEAFFLSTQKLAPDIPGEPGFVDAIFRGFIKGRISKHLKVDIDPESDESLARYARLKVTRLDDTTWVADYSIGEADEICLIGRINICGGWQVVMEGAPPATQADTKRFLNSFSMMYRSEN